MRNLFYITACIIISIVIGLFSPLISLELFNFDDSKETEYVEVVEIKPEKKVEKTKQPQIKKGKASSQLAVIVNETQGYDSYIEEFPPETFFQINKYGKNEFWNYYRDVSRIKFSKQMRNLYEETYRIKKKENSKFKYSIHIYVSKKATPISQLKLKGLYENFDMNENLYRYFYRSFDNYWVCRKELRQVRSKGFPDAYIVKL